jgi:hypothetical protein
MATIFTDAGKAYVAAKLDGTNTNSPNRIGWGTGAGTAAAADTTLFTEAAEARATATLSHITTTVANDTFKAVGTLTSASGQSITNAGVFDAATTGNLVVKADHTAIPLLTNDSIAYTFQLKFS